MCWFDLKTDKLVHDPWPKSAEEIKAKGGKKYMRSVLDNYEMRQTSLEENTKNLMYVIDAIRSMNTSNKVILTVSPVPMNYCQSDYPLLSADFISKSILRLAVDEVGKHEIDGVFYFPSFEIVRWAAPHFSGSFWGGENTDGNPV